MRGSHDRDTQRAPKATPNATHLEMQNDLPRGAEGQSDGDCDGGVEPAAPHFLVGTSGAIDGVRFASEGIRRRRRKLARGLRST